jgi:toxin ParE1/3/4
MKYRWHPLAEAEYDEAVDYYLLHADPVVGRHFVTVVNSALELLSTHPAIGVHMHNEARRISLHGFPFDLVYRLKRENILIIALANQYRRPGYWARRR